MIFLFFFNKGFRIKLVTGGPENSAFFRRIQKLTFSLFVLRCRFTLPGSCSTIRVCCSNKLCRHELCRRALRSYCFADVHPPMRHHNEPGHQPYQVCLVIVFGYFSGYVSLCVHSFTLGELDLWGVCVGDDLPIHKHPILTFEQTLSNNQESNWISLLFKIIYKTKLLNVFTFYQYDAQQKKIHL